MTIDTDEAERNRRAIESVVSVAERDRLLMQQSSTVPGITPVYNEPAKPHDIRFATLCRSIAIFCYSIAGALNMLGKAIDAFAK